MPDSDPLPSSGEAPPSPTYCLCVKDGGHWKRAVTVTGTDQLEAFERAKKLLPESFRDKPLMFRESSLCGADEAGREH
jgi:hypothetical protein